MKRRTSAVLLPLLLLPLGCGDSDSICASNDVECDGVPNDLGVAVDLDGKRGPDLWDYDGNGSVDGYQVDRNDDGVPDALGLDLNADGRVDAVDINLDGIADESTPNGTYGQPQDAGPLNQGGGCLDDGGAHAVSGAANGSDSAARYANADVQRGGQTYRLIANGWGDNWQSHNISWNGTQMAVNSFAGTTGPDFSPAGYPTLYLGDYSNTGTSPGAPLPRALSEITALPTGVRWSHPGARAEDVYNVAYDVWLSTNGVHSGYFMVWLRDPPTARPAGGKRETAVQVPGVPNTWEIWAGEVNGRPIINYVRTEGQVTNELAFDMMAFINHAVGLGYVIPGTEVMSVAIGFEIWEGPIAGLAIDDFCVGVQ